jgi:hypothetical protein
LRDDQEAGVQGADVFLQAGYYSGYLLRRWLSRFCRWRLLWLRDWSCSRLLWRNSCLHCCAVHLVGALAWHKNRLIRKEFVIKKLCPKKEQTR